MEEILKVIVGQDDDNDNSDQVMLLEDLQWEMDTSYAISSSSLSNEDCKIFDIPLSEFMSIYNDNAHDTMQEFLSIMEAENFPGYYPSCLTCFVSNEIYELGMKKRDRASINYGSK